MVFKKAWLAVPAFFFIAAALSFVAVRQFQHNTPLGSIAQIAIPDPSTLFSRGSLKVLVVGLDYDYDEKDQETSAHSRSDIIMAINLDFAKRRVYELSIPRDMVATMPNGQTAKINQAQSEGGINESQSVVSKWLDIPGFDRYVVLRIDTMKDLIDALGGVDVVVKDSDCLRYHTHCAGGSVDYDDSWGHLHVHLQEGLHHLSGEQAVGYARFRHDWCSDPCRIMRQQQVVASIVQRIKGNDLNTIAHILPLVDVIRKDVDTNLTMQEEVSIANAFRSMGPGDLKTAQVPYSSEVDLPQYGASIVADETEKKRLVRTMLYDVPSPVSQRQ